MKIEIQTKVCKKMDIIKLLQMKHLETVTEWWLEEKQNVPINECPDK